MRKSPGRPWFIGVLVVAVAGVGFGLYWFQPWKLWQDETVEEALPGVAGTSAPPAAASSGPRRPPAAGPQTLASGELISHEHATSAR